MEVFFYGLFMDEQLLAKKGVSVSGIRPGFLDGYGLRIGQRATLVRDPKRRAWGVVMTITAREAELLYAEPGVADYEAEPVTVALLDGSKVEATCYNLPVDKITGTNRDYARALLALASRLGFPEAYLDDIRRAVWEGL